MMNEIGTIGTVVHAGQFGLLLLTYLLSDFVHLAIKEMFSVRAFSIRVQVMLQNTFGLLFLTIAERLLQ